METATPSAKAARRRLTREELLAGKCFPDENNEAADHRFKNPDSLLGAFHGDKPASAHYDADMEALEKKLHQVRSEMNEERRAWHLRVDSLSAYREIIENAKTQRESILASLQSLRRMTAELAYRVSEIQESFNQLKAQK